MTDKGDCENYQIGTLGDPLNSFCIFKLQFSKARKELGLGFGDENSGEGLKQIKGGGN